MDHSSLSLHPAHAAALLLILLLPSCSLLHRVERLNASTYLRQTLADLSQESRRPLTTDIPLLLYPLPTLPQGEGDRLYTTALKLGDPHLLEQVALVTGHPERALDSEDTHRAMMAAALVEDTVRLSRLIGTNPDVAMAYSLAHLRGDTIAAKRHLAMVLEGKGYPAETKRLAAWALAAYPSRRAEAIDRLISMREPGPLREWAEMLGDAELTADYFRLHTPIILSTLPRGSLMERMLLADLRERLWSLNLWPEALQVQKRLADDRYSEILRYERDIALLEAYEHPAREQAETGVAMVEGQSFVERFGPVRNVNNWAMNYGGYSGVTASRRLTPDEYRRLHARLTSLLRPETGK